MARVTYGSGVTELAGSIGGVTYQKNTSGNIARLRPNPVVNPTALQATYQTNMSILVSYWPTLSQADKDLWNARGAANDHTTPWGEIKTLSGYQWFMVANLHRLSLSMAILDTPPAWFSIGSPPSFVIETSATYIRGYWSTAIPASYRKKLYVTLPLRQSSLKLRRSLFYIATIVSGTPITYWDFTTEFEALANVTWATFFASADCSIIARVLLLSTSAGIAGAFTSAIIKI